MRINSLLNQYAMGKKVEINSLFAYQTERGQYYEASKSDNFKRKTRITQEQFEKIRSLGELFIYKGQIAYGW